MQNNECFCILVDEGKDNSDAELLSLVLQQVREGLEVKEKF